MSSSAFHDFVNCLKQKVERGNSSIYCEALLVTYYYNNKVEQEVLPCTFRRDTMGYGKVALDDGDVIHPDNFHLDFDTDYQEYKFENNTLIIIGQSLKMGGKYRVEIKEM